MTLTDDNVGDYADTLVHQARDQGRNLDYSAASLDHLDDLFGFSDELLRADTFPDVQRNLIIFYAGCYLGETLARRFGGVWNFAENWYDSTLNFPSPNGGIQLRPFHKVRQRTLDGPDGNRFAAYRDGLSERLSTN